MTFSQQQITEAVIAAYPKSEAWAERVTRMSDARRFALFMRIINDPRRAQVNEPASDSDPGSWLG